MSAAGPLRPHERWFVASDDLPTRWGDLLTGPTLLAVGPSLALVAGVVLLWHTAARRRPLVPGPLGLGATPERLAVLMGWVPLLLAVHTAIPLLVGGVNGQLFAPNLSMAEPAGAFVGLAEIGVALLLFYGVFTRYAALALAGLWLAGVALFGPVLMLEQTIYLGLAAFFFIAGRGPIAVDRVFGAWAGARERLLPVAVPALRVATGVSITWLALTEKLLNMPLALRFLERYPHANFFPEIGLPVGDAAFVRLAGAVELTAGLLLLFGAFPRIVILVLWLPFNLTLVVFGWRELVGHLPIYSVIALLLLWGSGDEEDVEALRSGLVPMAEKPLGATAQRAM